MSFLKTLQAKPPFVKKVILWLIVMILGALMLMAVVSGFKKRAANLNTNEFMNKLNVPINTGTPIPSATPSPEVQQ